MPLKFRQGTKAWYIDTATDKIKRVRVRNPRVDVLQENIIYDADVLDEPKIFQEVTEDELFYQLSEAQAVFIQKLQNDYNELKKELQEKQAAIDAVKNQKAEA